MLAWVHSKCQGIHFSVNQDPDQQLYVGKACLCDNPRAKGKSKGGSENSERRPEAWGSLAGASRQGPTW